MKRIFLAAVLLAGCASPLTAVRSGEAGYPVYRDGAEEWVAPLAETSRYASLEDAGKGAAEKDRVNVWGGFPLRGRNGEWLRLADDEGGEFWAAASGFTDIDSYLKNPPPGALVNCENPAPGPFRVNLDANRKNARVLVQHYPTLRGGAGIIEVRDGGTADLLWHSEPLDKTGWDNFLFCSQSGDRHLQFAGDVNGDGAAELVIKGAQSEIGPGAFTLLRWNGTAFVPLFADRQFLSLGKSEPVRFSAVSADEGPGNIYDGQKRVWVDDFIETRGDGTVTASVSILEKGAQGQGKARLRFDGEWIPVFAGWETAPVMEPF